MKKLIWSALLSFSILSCKNKSQTSNQVISRTKDTFYFPSYPVNKFEGSYTGAFSKGFLTIILNYVQGKIASGYEIQRGERKNLNGSIIPNGKSFAFIMKEPGKSGDGILQFTIDTSKFIMSGNWKPIDTSQIESKPLLLKKQAKKTEAAYENELGTWIPQKGNYRKDTTLDFSSEGVCEYKFYQFPGDLTSHLISVKGSYILKKDSVFIEWQKNAWTNMKKMKLVRVNIKSRNGNFEEPHLVGEGWNLIRLEGD